MSSDHRPDAKIQALQLLRGISIAYVLVCHVSLSATLMKEVPYPLTMPFWLGVEVFFLISGYVIINALARDRYEPFSFLVKRVFRLTPAVLVFVGLATAINAWMIACDPPDYVRHLGFVSYWTDFRRMAKSVILGYFTLQPRSTYSFGAMWSLSVEDQFYAALAVVALGAALAARSRAPRVVPGLFVGLSVAVYLAVAACRVAHLFGGNLAARMPQPVPYLVNLRFEFLALGILTAYADRAFKDRIGRAVAGRGAYLAPPLLLVPTVMGFFVESPLSAGGPGLTALLLLAGPCFAALVLVAAHDDVLPHRGLRAARGVLRYLGDRSYTLYLLHFPLMLAVWHTYYRYLPWAYEGEYRYALMQLGGLFVLLLPLTELVYRGVELPLTAVGKRLAKRVRIVPAAPAVPAPLGFPAPVPGTARRAA